MDEKLAQANAIREIQDCTAQTVSEAVEKTIGNAVLPLAEPACFRNLVSDWPSVNAGIKSAQHFTDYLLKFYSGDPVTAFAGPSSIRGRIGYNENLSGFNYQQGTTSFAKFIEELFQQTGSTEPDARYMGSTLLNRWFPGFRAENDLALDHFSPLASIWIGNRIRVSAHFDVASNIACNVVGRRRFTLFPPDQIDNLYIGPWDRTPAGQAISLVDFAAPDFDQHPRFRQALDAATTVTLEPGDALYIPSMWWHHVEGLDEVNVLVNYWWRSTPRFLGSPLAVLKHALLELKDLPSEQRLAWRHIFDYYVFDSKEENIEHIPTHSRGILGDIDDTTARMLRAELLNLLNR